MAVEWGRPRLAGLEMRPQRRPRERNKKAEKQMPLEKIDNAKTLSQPAVARDSDRCCWC